MFQKSSQSSVDECQHIIVFKIFIKTEALINMTYYFVISAKHPRCCCWLQKIGSIGFKTPPGLAKEQNPIDNSFWQPSLCIKYWRNIFKKKILLYFLAQLSKFCTVGTGRQVLVLGRPPILRQYCLGAPPGGNAFSPCSHFGFEEKLQQVLAYQCHCKYHHWVEKKWQQIYKDFNKSCCHMKSFWCQSIRLVW